MAFVLVRACLSAVAAISAIACLPLAGCSSPPDAVETRRVEISTPPIAHVVLITLKDPTRAAELVEDCNRLVPGIPSVLAYSCGLPLPSDRANVVGDYSVGFFVAFADEAGYREYTDHPSHLALVDKWRTAWKEVRIFDFVDGMVPPAEPKPSEIPAEALAGYGRRQHQNRRRERDPLGEGHPCTWQTRLIKVAARVTESARRVLVELSGSWPYLGHYRRVSEQVLAFLMPEGDSS